MNILFAGTYSPEHQAQIIAASSLKHSIKFEEDQDNALWLLRKGKWDIVIADWVIKKDGREVNCFDLIKEVLDTESNLIVRGQVNDTRLQPVLERMFDSPIAVLLGKEVQIDTFKRTKEG